jgi:HAD superfamily phosphoserine phosphatase-like hydrolase
MLTFVKFPLITSNGIHVSIISSPMSVNKRKVAVFDVDGTIFRSSLLVHIVDALIEANLFPKEAEVVFEDARQKWLEREGDYETYIAKVIEANMLYIRGVGYADFAKVVERVVTKERRKTYKFTRDLIAELKGQNYYLAAISQSYKFALDVFLAEIGFDKVYGRVYEIGPENRFTGEIVDLHLIANKANIVRRLVEREGLSLDDLIAVGDTEDDIPVLELAQRPVAFNPNAKLYKHAKRLGWEIVVERKDVIYKL